MRSPITSAAVCLALLLLRLLNLSTLIDARLAGATLHLGAMDQEELVPLTLGQQELLPLTLLFRRLYIVAEPYVPPGGRLAVYVSIAGPSAESLSWFLTSAHAENVRRFNRTDRKSARHPLESFRVTGRHMIRR